MRRYFLALLLLLAALPLRVVSNDTLRLQDFLARVKATHPLARQADILPEIAEAQLRQARGAFDPVATAGQREKTFLDQISYDARSAGIKLPIAGIVDVSAGIDRNVGPFINREASTSGGSLTYVGIEVNVLRGLLLDERRAVLRQARLLPALSQAERAKVLNKLLFDAGKDYWEWWNAWRQLELATTGVQLAQFRLRGTVEGVINGDRAPIDTAEASLEVLRRQVQAMEAQLAFTNMQLVLETYLWTEDFRPDSLPGTTRPPLQPADETPLVNTDSLRQFAFFSHPDVLAQELKRAQLDIDRRLARWNLLPELTLEAKPYVQQRGNGIPWNENYRWGAALYFPLLLRKERGKYQETRLKVDQADAALQDIRRVRTNQVLQSDNEWMALGRLVRNQEQTLERAEQLLEGENEMFRNGESSLFLINQRERSVLEARLKLADLQSKRQKTALARLAAAGLLPEQI